MAELERSVIRERFVAGLDYARAHGTKSGHPSRMQRFEGMFWLQIANSTATPPP
ncbi:MAG TPA: hypothetical protein VHC90_06420 [Bryobacteraceae bacterium]|nr:hypothetical protein [Bryobacteraceae bacterium]